MPEVFQNDQAENARKWADDKARAAYQSAVAAGQSEANAIARAKAEWDKTYQEAQLTGMYKGAYTMPTQQEWATQFGTWGTPTQGQQTLGAQQQDWQQAYNTANQYGQFYGVGQQPTVGTQTQSAQEQAYTQWLRGQQQALAEQAQQQQSANQYLTLLSNLRGPADWQKYQQVLGAGGNMNTLAAAAMGQYIPGGGATSGYQPQAANLNTLYGQVAGAGQPNVAAFTPGGTGMPTGAAPTDQQQNALGGGTNTMGAGPTQAQQMNLPAPNQIAMQSWKNLAPSQQEMLKGAYESQGWYKPDVEALMNQSLPKYATNTPGAGTWRLK